jgi:hypothetical protein
MANPRKKVIKNTLFNEYKRGDISQEDNNALNLINSQYAKDMIQQGALSGELNKGFVKRYEKKADRAYNQYSNPSARAQWVNARDKGTRYGNMKKANNLEGVSLAYKMPNMTGQSKTLATAPREKLQQVDMNNALGKKFERATSGSIPEESYTEPTQMMSTTTSAMKGMNKDGSYYGLNNDELMFEARQKAKLGQTKQKEMNYPMKKAKNSYKYGGKMTYNGIKLK